MQVCAAYAVSPQQYDKLHINSLFSRICRGHPSINDKSVVTHPSFLTHYFPIHSFPIHSFLAHPHLTIRSSLIFSSPILLHPFFPRRSSPHYTFLIHPLLTILPSSILFLANTSPNHPQSYHGHPDDLPRPVHPLSNSLRLATNRA